MRSVAKSTYRRRVKSLRLLELVEQLRIRMITPADGIAACAIVSVRFGEKLTAEQGNIVASLISDGFDPHTKPLRNAIVDLLAAVYCTTDQSVQRDMKRTCFN